MDVAEGEALATGKGWIPNQARKVALWISTVWHSEKSAVVKNVNCIQPGQNSIIKPLTSGRPYCKVLRIAGLAMAEVPVSLPF